MGEVGGGLHNLRRRAEGHLPWTHKEEKGDCSAMNNNICPSTDNYL